MSYLQNPNTGCRQASGNARLILKKATFTVKHNTMFSTPIISPKASIVVDPTFATTNSNSESLNNQRNYLLAGATAAAVDSKVSDVVAPSASSYLSRSHPRLHHIQIGQTPPNSAPLITPATATASSSSASSNSTTQSSFPFHA